ncbi:prolipoprotein diacylglyceryl transferase [uncultured Schumannella sp.]|uniref:prolipoprotein diacylglyceryl transferase n=1 Tax=uncultured Schumannella sp. TaxID=1195956 RepID=UPI0025ED5C0B|nr:prolipoprotein diacylglyceryl transferase [uncultured Schumannella sp.]
MTFPQLTASIPSPDISYIDLGPFRLHFYAIFILIGVVLAVLLTGRRISASGFKGGDAIDIALWAVPFGIVGARLYHVVTHPGDYFYPGADLLKVLYVWEGGIAIFGAVVFGLVGIWIGARRTKIPFLVFLDALAPGMLIAQAVGRIGNYFNQELFGSPTTLPWGLQIDPSRPAFPAGFPEDTLFHPLFLYELLWNLVGAATILLVERAVFRDRRPRPGTGLSLGLYLVWYGIGRAWFEWLRLDPTELLVAGVKINLLTALAAAVVGILIIVNARRVERRRVPEPNGELAAEGL